MKKNNNNAERKQRGFQRVSPETFSPPILRPRGPKKSETTVKATDAASCCATVVTEAQINLRPEYQYSPNRAEKAADKNASGLTVSLPPEPASPSSGAKSGGGETQDALPSQPRHLLFINSKYNGMIFKLNKQFKEYQPAAMTCEVTRSGTKVTLSSAIDVDNYENLLKVNNIQYSKTNGSKIKTKRLVLKGIDPTVSPADIQVELECLGFEVKKVVNMTSFKTKGPLPMYMVDLVDGPNACEALNIKSLCYYKIKVEIYRKFKVPPQCSNCQRYNHTAGHCRGETRCRYCAGSHHTSTCTKAPDVKKKCCLCHGGHTANFKGCKAYKDLIKRDQANPNKTKEPSRVKTVASQAAAKSTTSAQQKINKPRTKKSVNKHDTPPKDDVSSQPVVVSQTTTVKNCNQNKHDTPLKDDRSSQPVDVSQTATVINCNKKSQTETKRTVSRAVQTDEDCFCDLLSSCEIHKDYIIQNLEKQLWEMVDLKCTHFQFEIIANYDYDEVNFEYRVKYLD